VKLFGLDSGLICFEVCNKRIDFIQNIFVELAETNVKAEQKKGFDPNFFHDSFLSDPFICLTKLHFCQNKKGLKIIIIFILGISF
jgi:hypothetical protein